MSPARILVTALIAPLLTATLLAACLQPPSLGAAVREFVLEAGETPVEIYPGKTVTMWTFNGIAPGPLIRVREGDLVRVRFYNNHTLPHNLHLHGAHPVDMDGLAEVAPGDSFTYEFTAGPAGAFVYHCHVDTRIHIQKGLYGQFIVDPKQGWGAPQPEREHFVVFSDWNPQLNATPEAFTLNGRSFPSTIPFPVEVGRAARFYVSSLSMIAVAAHFHGVLSQQVWPNPQPIDVVPLSPGETRVLDYRSDHEGVWLFHDHYEDHLVNDDQYPGGTVGLIQVGREHWSAPASHDHADPVPSASAGPREVLMKDYRYQPQTVRARVGQSVTWRNEDASMHTITSDQAAGPLASADLQKGASYSYTFEAPGTYAYHCRPHSFLAADGYRGMVGIVIVDAA